MSIVGDFDFSWIANIWPQREPTAGPMQASDAHFITRPWVKAHEEFDEHKITIALLTIPIPGAAAVGGVAKSLRWLNKVRKQERPIEWVMSTKWRTAKTYMAIGNVLGTASIIGYYKDKYVQEALWKIVNGEDPDDVLTWLEGEGIPIQDSLPIVLDVVGLIDSYSRGNEGQAFPASRDIPFSSGTFFSLERWKLPSVQPTRASALPLDPSSRRLGRTKSGSTAERGRGRSSVAGTRPPYCRVHKRYHSCRLTRAFRKNTA